MEYIPPNHNLGYTTIDNNDYTCVLSFITFDNQARLVISDLDMSSETCVSIDWKWNYKDGSSYIMQILQLFFTNQKVSVIHLS